MLAPLLALALAVAPLPQAAPRASVEGGVYTVREGARVALPFASVELLDAQGRVRGASADEQGRFRLVDVAPGPHAVRVTHVGYRTVRLEVVVPASGVLRVDVEVGTDPVRMPGVTVRGEREPVPTAGEAGGSTAVDPGAAVRILEEGSGIASSGLLDAVRGLPGEDPPDESDALFMRGSALDLKRVRLDGAPVFTPFHVGGLIPSFDEWLLGRTDLWVGAAPARYDGGLDYVLDLRTRRPDRARANGSASVDLLGARAAVATPVGERAGVLVGGRILHGALERLLSRGASPYGYADGLARADIDLGERATLRATGFWNREDVSLDYAAAGSAAARAGLPERAEWGNRAGSVALEVPVAGGRLSLLAAGGRYDAGLPLAGQQPAYASGHTTRQDASADWSRPREGGGALTFGLDAERIEAVYQARGLASDGSVRLFDNAADSWLAAAYGDLRMPVGERTTLQAGLRATHAEGQGVLLAPRLGVAWLLTDQAALSLSVGRYHQLVATADEQIPEGLAAAVTDSTPAPPLGSATLFRLARANHVVVSLDQMLSPTTRLGLDGFYKRFEGLLSAPGAVLSSSGVDLRVRRSGARFDGWAGYSLSWHWRQGASSATSEQFVGRQLLSAGLVGQLTPWSGLDVRLSYGDGLPLTAVATATDGEFAPGLENAIASPDPTTVAVGAARDEPALTGGPSGDFLRLDAEVYGLFERRVGSRTHQVRPYVKVLNALDRRDALFYYFERWRGEEPRPLAELSVLPVVGIEWRF